MTLFWRQPRHAPAIRIALPELEPLVAAISDLAPAVADLTTAVTSAVTVLTTPPSGDTTVLSPTDQATLDTAVAAVQQATANLNAALPQTAPVEQPPADGSTDQPTA